MGRVLLGMFYKIYFCESDITKVRQAVLSVNGMNEFIMMSFSFPGPVKPAQNENSMLKRIFSMFGSTSQKQALRPHNPPAKVACLSLRKPSKGAGKRSGSPRTPRPGLARRARADSLVLKVSPCDEATEKHR